MQIYQVNNIIYQDFQKQEWIPQVQEQFQSEQYALDRHNHTCQHLKHCKLQYQEDSQHPESDQDNTMNHNWNRSKR